MGFCWGWAVRVYVTFFTHYAFASLTHTSLPLFRLWQGHTNAVENSWSCLKPHSHSSGKGILIFCCNLMDWPPFTIQGYFDKHSTGALSTDKRYLLRKWKSHSYCTKTFKHTKKLYFSDVLLFSSESLKWLVSLKHTFNTWPWPRFFITLVQARIAAFLLYYSRYILWWFRIQMSRECLKGSIVLKIPLHQSQT